MYLNVSSLCYAQALSTNTLRDSTRMGFENILKTQDKSVTREKNLGKQNAYILLRAAVVRPLETAVPCSPWRLIYFSFPVDRKQRVNAYVFSSHSLCRVLGIIIANGSLGNVSPREEKIARRRFSAGETAPSLPATTPRRTTQKPEPFLLCSGPFRNDISVLLLISTERAQSATARDRGRPQDAHYDVI